ncbi:hypothetical protein D3C87_679680 [compost metagenome]
MKQLPSLKSSAMESLKDFSVEQIVMSKIFGGDNWIQTTAKPYEERGYLVRTTDSYNDKNKNNSADLDEEFSMCLSYEPIK